jgi:ABC-2 type transport system permease protein
MKLLRDSSLQFQRAMWLTLHNPVWVFVGLTQPILYLVLFAPLLRSLAGPGITPETAFNVFVPGLLIQLGLFGAAFVGFGLIDEMREGVVERMRVTPTSRVSMLIGRAGRDVVITLVQGLLLVVVAIPFGLSVSLEGLLVVLGLLALMGLLMASISYALALKLRDEDSFAPLVMTVSLPLLLLSGVLLPLTLAPDWLRTLASINPLSHAVDAARALFNGQFADPSVIPGVVLMAVLAVVGLAIGGRAFNRLVA